MVYGKKFRFHISNKKSVEGFTGLIFFFSGEYLEALVCNF